jgi:N-acetylglucosamine kinase-like BadF-type ATPase
MSYYLGLDGGGTKTVAVVIDDTGRVLGEARGGASNPLRTSFARAFTALDDAAARALAVANADSAEVRGVSVGVAGTGRPRSAERVVAFLTTRFRDASIEALTDLEIALESVAEAGPAVVLVAGTGSAAFGRNASGQTARAGGWGPWFDDEGSAFDIGRGAMNRVARSRDSGAATLRLEQAIASQFGVADWQQVVGEVMRKPLDRLPEVFPAVVAAADAGDDVARGLLTGAADQLAFLATAVIRRLGLDRGAFALGRVGGVFGRASLLDERVVERLATVAPHAQLSKPAYSPAHAAARRALRKASASS